ncbi:hypothetical protein [Candidatus Contendibacter odensensis]|uniref:SH3b domain-containing protein n=1 Tax=Candidatus Contendobacter odensis Run_B_J11 TaxID=1400861 RepID=A0A7U7GE29_9GAMM|nr:hypothetical protein [Candidatus Contendobacter odensis]CDH46468.1 conserved exported hypothetical protein [Candidatus Contendobacter odensis Run_B_J11]
MNRMTGILLGLVALLSIASAQTVNESPPSRCQSKEDLAEPFTPVEFKVVGQGRLYFYSAPFPECKTALFIIPNDYGYSQALHEGWASITYFSQGDVISGWVEAKRLEMTDPRVARGEIDAPPKAALAP